MSLNPKTVVEIAQRNETSENFFTYAACRERNVRNGVSSLHAVRSQMEKEGFTPVPQDLLVMFRELERAGVGKLEGDLFKWEVPIRELGEIVESKPSKLSRIESPVVKNSKILVFCFGHNKELSLEFTPGLTKDDVKFLYEKLLKECA